MNFHKINLRKWMSKDLKILYLALSAVTGWLSGIAFALSSFYLFQDFDFTVFTERPSFVCLLAVNLLPLIMFYLLRKFSLDWFCYPLVFLLSLSVGFSGLGLSCVFHNSAWLIRLCLLTSCSVSSLFIWIFLLLYKKGSYRPVLKDVCIFSVPILFITVFDEFWIIPFFLDAFTTI